MKKSLSLLAVLAVLGFAGTPAQAADHYVSGMAGVSWMQDSAIGLFNVEEIFDTEVNLGYGSGLTLAGAIGCDYGSTRLEAEFGYQNADIKDISIGNISIPGGPTLTGGSVPLEGDVNVLSLMANGFYDFDLGGVELYAMAGVGVAQVNMEITDIANLKASLPSVVSPVAIDLTETTLAYQVGAGLAIPVSDGVMIDARYRYFATTDFNVIGVIDTNVSSHSAMLGLRVNL
ncbi:MAG: porin family protein [Chlorobiaceae bacterium]|nr:porin family protein [Chlorobiaceae bacterium]